MLNLHITESRQADAILTYTIRRALAQGVSDPKLLILKNKKNNNKKPKQQELLQLLLQIVVVVVFAVVIVVLLFEKCACEGGCQGASRPGHRP